MKKRRIAIFLIVLCIVIGVPCLINMSNFYLGSNNMFFKTINECPDTFWICEETEAKITVSSANFNERFGKAIMEINIDGEDVKFEIISRADILNLEKLDEKGDIIDAATYKGNKNNIRTTAKYKKNILGEVTSFQITVKDEDLTVAGYKTLKFVKQK